MPNVAIKKNKKTKLKNVRIMPQHRIQENIALVSKYREQEIFTTESGMC